MRVCRETLMPAHARSQCMMKSLPIDSTRRCTRGHSRSRRPSATLNWKCAPNLLPMKHRTMATLNSLFRLPELYFQGDPWTISTGGWALRSIQVVAYPGIWSKTKPPSDVGTFGRRTARGALGCKR